MTQRQIGTLAQRQLKKSLSTLANLSEKRKLNVSPLLEKQLIKNCIEEPQKMQEVGNYFVERIVFHKNKSSLAVLVSLLSEKQNPNKKFRQLALYCLEACAFRGEKSVLKGLIIGTKDSSDWNRVSAYRGLGRLAVKGSKIAARQLAKGLKDKNKTVLDNVLHFLKEAAGEGNQEAAKIFFKLNK